jgi:hypothetical protein
LSEILALGLESLVLNARGMWALAIVGALLIGFTVFWLSPESGEREFGRAVEAVKLVRSYRYSSVTAPRPTRHTEAHGEMSCSQAAFHQLIHVVDEDLKPSDFIEETVRLNTGTFQRAGDGTWSRRTLSEGWEKPEQLCTKLSSGVDIQFFPDVSRMQKNGIFERGESKDAGGVQCRVWKVQVTEYGSGLENRTVCLGVKDHLPYEVTSDYDGSRTTFSDFNAAIEIPEMTSIAASDDGSRANNP